MRAGAIAMYSDGKTISSTDGSNLLFSTGSRELRAFGQHLPISTPARGGEDWGSQFQRSVRQALDEARAGGQDNPIVMGAIPFDMREPSCLYVPQAYEWRERQAPRAPDGADRLPALLDQRSIPDEPGFKKAVEQAILNFRHGDIRKVVLSVMRELRFAGSVDVDSLLDSLAVQNSSGYQFRVPLPDGGELIGVSPELLLQKEGDRFVSNPLAGSARRQPFPEADQATADALLQSPKDLYEHRVVIDDIRRVLEPHCAELVIPTSPSVISTAALWHLSTRLHGRLSDPQTSALQLACRLHPTPAVCGTPTEQAHKLIRFVEPFERGLFTGMVGWCDSKGDGEWVVTLRCGIVDREIVRLFAGAGIVEASQPEAEWAETQTKLKTMLNACGLAA
ncbi:isochorismate synthase [Labrys sp. KNU-23]|uniref:isochorismate synthase n=1 Tax=Labrys sp. KNU-23 TaxID=2789216 RepID=UPI0011F091CE|nr:isochorismate synthase [Labrys sp. KNU-23]QEN85518.1 isochorismate synthase [Labrys sp. KNU-23]